MKKASFLLIINLSLAFFCGIVHAQSNIYNGSKNDSNYYVTYPGSITARYYFSQKYTSFTMQGSNGKKDIKYRPNTTLNMGVGATYNNLTLNLAYGFGFMNNDKEKGKTKYLDLQAHAYPGKWSLDLICEFYKGYHLQPKGFANNNIDQYYYRPDVKVNLFGIAAYRILNHRKFSYNAAILQNEWQRKSAGSILYGAEIYYGSVKGDSALVPKNSGNIYPQAGLTKYNFFSFGPGIGYAYSLVVKQHFFLMGSATLNLNLGFSTETGGFLKRQKTAISPETFFRFAAGYNSSTWNVSVNWIGNVLQSRGASTNNNYLFQVGNYRINFAKKLHPGPKVKKLLRPVDKIMGIK